MPLTPSRPRSAPLLAPPPSTRERAHRGCTDHQRDAGAGRSGLWKCWWIEGRGVLRDGMGGIIKFPTNAPGVSRYTPQSVLIPPSNIRLPQLSYPSPKPPNRQLNPSLLSSHPQKNHRGPRAPGGISGYTVSLTSLPRKSSDPIIPSYSPNARPLQLPISNLPSGKDLSLLASWTYAHRIANGA